MGRGSFQPPEKSAFPNAAAPRAHLGEFQDIRVNRPSSEYLDEASVDHEIRVLERGLEELGVEKAAAAVVETIECLRELLPQMSAEQRCRLDEIERRCKQSREGGVSNVP
jgi:hypothetical protein